MKLFLLTLLAMIAFAANSVLTRLAVDLFDTDPMAFAVLRIAAGVAVLWAMMLLERRGWPAGSWRRRLSGGVALGVYVVGFSLAYLTLDTGVGALILFGVVQFTMFAGALYEGERLPASKAIGAGLALLGLAVLVWPDPGVSMPLNGILMMGAAAVGWGIYSLQGRSEPDPMAATAANFAVCLPLVMPFIALGTVQMPMQGIILAIVAGGVTSGLGYALWYSVVPGLGAIRAGIAQLSVPLLAAVGGAVFLGEAVGWRFTVAAVLILGGIALSLIRR